MPAVAGLNPVVNFIVVAMTTFWHSANRICNNHCAITCNVGQLLQPEFMGVKYGALMSSNVALMQDC